jgi:hypothetical protein
MVTLAITPLSKRLRSLVRHIEDVQQDCQILGTHLIERGELDVGRTLIANGFVHDHSKFEGIEWEHLTTKEDPLFEEAWRHHTQNNKHHPEFWLGGIHEMERVYVAEMVCDWHSRSSEFCSGLREWIEYEATRKYHFGPSDEVARQIQDFVNLLSERWD